MTKTCTNCKIEKPVECFCRSRRDGHQSECKECRAARASTFRESNRSYVLERERQQRAKLRDKNPEEYARKQREKSARQAALNPEKHRERKAKYYAKRREVERIGQMNRLYGLSHPGFLAMLSAQGNRCAICKSEFVGGSFSANVDHCHKTNKVRGLLCGSCNRAVGLLKDSYEVCESAAAYLKNHL
jgi:hypothetical protein